MKRAYPVKGAGGGSDSPRYLRWVCLPAHSAPTLNERGRARSEADSHRAPGGLDLQLARMRRLPVLLLLLWVCATFYTGIYLFVGGFMLVRLEVNRSSSCSDVLPPGDQAGRFCSGEPRFRRAVLLIIDALKINFAQFDPTNVMPLPFENKLPVLQEVTESQPTNSRLFAFRADPPTTTMQRIKGFTTGSLPTFIDVGNNFASNSILEDNLVHQLGEAGKRVVFMGDDTWESLFPKKFHRSLPFPSFNVKDLHTVDDGILKHLYPTLQSSDWDVLIAHFLGVDHCGHRFGPNHPAMADKLTQMDEVIRSVIRLIKNDTLLVVMGDHGMTDTGDHGGESLKETDAALFLYSPTPLFPPFGSQVEPEVVPQTDLVPTLALLLGIPIPYSSIGQVLLPIFPQHTDAAGTQPHLTQAEALWINSKQVNRFLETYAHMARDISPESLSLLQERFAGLAAEYRRALQEGRVPSPALLNGLQAYLSAVRDVCRATWARFHPLKILSGLLLLATTCLVTLGVSELPRLAGGVEGPSLAPPVVVGVLAGGAVVTVQLMSVGWAEAGWFLGTAAFASQSVFLWRLLRAGRWAKASQIQRCGWRRLLLPLPCVPLLILFLRCASLLSDSYVIAEGRVVTFLLLSLGFYVPLRLNWDGLLFLPSPDPQKPPCPFPPVAPCSSSATRRESLALLACMGVLAASAYVVPSLAACREEQGDCEPSPLLLPLSRVQDGRARNLRYALSVASLAAWTCLLRLWLRRCGNLNGPGPAVLVARWVFPLAAVSVALHWAVDATPEDTFRGLADLIALALTALPRATFTLLGLGAALLWWDPLTVFLKARSLAGPSPAPRYRASTGVSTQAELRHLIPQLYQRMRLSLEDGGQPGALGMDGRPAVEAYGLGTVYSAALLLLAGLLGLGLLLLHPEGVSLAFVLLLLEGAALLQLHASSSNLVALQGALMGGFSVPWVQVILWDLAAIQFFHGTGHLPTFPSIQWGAAFVGFPKGHSGTLLPAALVTLNTFSSNILFAVGCPLLLFWPLVYEVRGGQRGGRGHIADGEEGDDTVMEMRLRERPADFSATLLQLAMRYLFVKGAQVLASALAAAILRRHLMVWRVFAPKLMFEASGFVVASVFILISFTLVMRVDIAVNSWFKRLIPEQSR